MKLPPFLLICPFFVLCTLGIVLISDYVNKRKSTLRLFGVFLIFRALIYFSISMLYYYPTPLQIYVEKFSGFILLLADPILFFALLSFVFPFRLILRQCWFFLLPAVILGSIYAIAYGLYPLDIQQAIALSFWRSETPATYPDIYQLQWAIDIILNVQSLFYLIIYIKILMINFPNFLRNYFSNSSKLNINWTIVLGLTLAILVVIYDLAPVLGANVLYALVIIETGLGFIIYFVLKNCSSLNIDVIETYFSLFLLNQKRLILLNKLFPERILEKLPHYTSHYAMGHAEKMINLHHQLIVYFESEKPYKQKDLCLDDIARALNSNRTYISQLFTKEIKTSFYDFVNTYRVEEAKLIMQLQPALSLKAIAEDCGFNSYTTFIKYFKEKISLGPNEWKNKYVSS